MDRTTIVAGLEDAGLSEYQAAAYLTLLEQGTSKAVDVARLCSIPTPRIYDVVEELEAMGYVETLDRETLHVRANEPIEVMSDLNERSERLSVTASTIEEKWERTPLSEYEANVYRRADTVIDHAQTLVAEATDSVEIAVSDAELQRFERPLAQLDGDVVVRLSVHCSDSTEALAVAPTDDVVTDVATEIRKRQYAAPLVVNVDGSTTCFAPTSLTPDPFGMVLHGSHVTVVFHWFFQTCLWEAWEPCYVNEDGHRLYASLIEFICDSYDGWRAGSTIPVTLRGVDTTTGDPRVVEGTVSDVQYTGQDDTDSSPTLDDLTGRVSIVVSTTEDTVTAGGWGAKIEDIETRVVEVHERSAVA